MNSEKANLRKQLLDKSITYAKNIQLIYPPKVDEQLKADLEYKKSQLTSQIQKRQERSIMAEENNNSRNGRNFIDELRRRRLEKLNNSISVNPENNFKDDDMNRNNYMIVNQKKRKHGKDGKNQSVINSSRGADVNQSVDYLRELRVQREQRFKDSGAMGSQSMLNMRKKKHDINDIERMMRDPKLNSAQKLQLAKEKTDFMEG